MRNTSQISTQQYKVLYTMCQSNALTMKSYKSSEASTETMIQTYKRQSVYIDGTTMTVKLTFRNHKLPEIVKIFSARTAVRLFEKKPLQCGKCLKYGHPAKRCSAEKICTKCLEQGHERNICDNEAKCLYCKNGGHITTNRLCPERRKQQNVTNIMALLQRLTYA